ncbi:hypothetical protein HWD35_20920 [Tsukamurella tyrosinosolvens]|uniref:hypothetical protein n=1 Tax=Tsukamurella tyrosinosolvens TaxID=57704 RepID=UPI001CE10DC8|nr:hypothetical protein [Tsukamurella tyrosinosolvens]MCA4997189.1 hypothetical protein [Tsukamurella tyrosinosolvens]
MTPDEWIDQTVRIATDGSVYFGEHKLPGIIAARGVTITPGGAGDVNEVTVRFIVGRVVVDDPLAV